MLINDLPDDVFIAIFQGNFPMQQWITYRAVCPHWKAVIESMCSSKRTLKIFPNLPHVYQYRDELVKSRLHEDDALKLKPIGADNDIVLSMERIDREVCDFISSLFPQLEYLVVYLCSNVNIALPHLLEQLNTLTGLALFGTLKEEEHFPEQVFAAINTLTNLEHLGLFLDEGLAHYLVSTDATALPIEYQLQQVVGKLKSFTTSNWACVPLLQCLHQECTDIAIHVPEETFNFGLHYMLSTSPSMAASLTSLTFSFISASNLRFVCANFPHINQLSIGFLGEITFDEILLQLYQLKVLTSLRITAAESVQLYSNNIQNTCIQNGIRPMNSMKKLRFDFGVPTPENLRSFYTTLAYLFPQLELLYLNPATVNLADHVDWLNRCYQTGKTTDGPLPKLMLLPPPQEFDHYGRHADRYRARVRADEEEEMSDEEPEPVHADEVEERDWRSDSDHESDPEEDEDGDGEEEDMDVDGANRVDVADENAQPDGERAAAALRDDVRVEDDGDAPHDADAPKNDEEEGAVRNDNLDNGVNEANAAEAADRPPDEVNMDVAPRDGAELEDDNSLVNQEEAAN